VSSNSSQKNLSDALLEIQKNPNRLLNIKRFGILLVIITLLCSILLPHPLILTINAAIFAAITVLYPQVLYPIYWLLTPILSIALKMLLAVFFYIIVTPAAFLARILGIDIIQQNIKPEVPSYWNERTTLVPHGKYMKNQR
jgi:Na+/pantothenate symporter